MKSLICTNIEKVVHYLYKRCFPSFLSFYYVTQSSVPSLLHFIVREVECRMNKLSEEEHQSTKWYTGESRSKKALS